MAYCRGDVRFNWKPFGLIPISLLLLSTYYGVMSSIKDEHVSPGVSVWLLAPSAVLATVGLLSIGWALFVRWGLTALPFLLITVLYASAQIPAYMMAFAILPNGLENFGDFKTVFSVLAAGKIPLVGYPLLLFLNPKQNRPDTAQPKFWPTHEAVRPHRYIVRALLWVLTTVTAATLGAL